MTARHPSIDCHLARSPAICIPLRVSVLYLVQVCSVFQAVAFYAGVRASSEWPYACRSTIVSDCPDACHNRPLCRSMLTETSRSSITHGTLVVDSTDLMALAPRDRCSMAPRSEVASCISNHQCPRQPSDQRSSRQLTVVPRPETSSHDDVRGSVRMTSTSSSATLRCSDCLQQVLGLWRVVDDRTRSRA